MPRTRRPRMFPAPAEVPEGVFLVAFDDDARFDSLGRIQFTTFWHGRRLGADPSSPAVSAQVSHTDLPGYLYRYAVELGYRVVFLNDPPPVHPRMPVLPRLDRDWPDNRPVPRGKRLVYGYVSTDDILRGKPGSVTDDHPVAMAVRRALAITTIPPYVGVGDDWFSINVQGSFWESHTLPDGTGDWTRAYDQRLAVRPFYFTFITAWGAPR